VPGNPPKELVIRDVREGTGQKVDVGDWVSIRFDMIRFAPREPIDSNRFGEPRRFKLGAGKEIPGWERGLVGMRVGGRRKLVVPPRLVFSNSGPEDTMVFVVDLVGAR
jgi:peptidylprolyl isomerase